MSSKVKPSSKQNAPKKSSVNGPDKQSQAARKKSSINGPVKQSPPKDTTPLPPKQSQPEAKEEPRKKEAPVQEVEKKNSNQWGNLLPHAGSDHWDEDMIPEALCCQILNEMITPPSSSEESYDSTDDKGKVIRKRRKKVRDVVEEIEEEEEEEEEEENVKYRTPSLPDISLDGCFNKEELRSIYFSIYFFNP